MDDDELDEEFEEEDDENEESSTDGLGEYPDTDMEAVTGEEEEDEQDDESMAKQIQNQVKEEAKQQAKQATKEATKKATKAAAKAAGKAMLVALKSVGMFLVSNPVGWAILGVIALIIIILVVVFIISSSAASEGAPVANVDPANGKFGTSLGMTGEYFYGGRLIYYNPEQAQTDLKDYYLALSDDFLDKIDAHEDITINAVAETTTEQMALEIAKVVSDSEDSLTLEQHLALITHFGYTTDELSTIKTNLVEFIVDNKSTILTVTDGYTGLETDITQIFDDNYAEYNVTAPLYYITDVILEGENVIPSQDAKNNVAFFYMPKEDVVLTDASHMFYFPTEETEGWATTIDFELVSVQGESENILASETVDPSWFTEDITEIKTTEPTLDNLTVAPFTNLDLTTPLNNVSIYSTILNENKSVIADYFTTSALFKVVDTTPESGSAYKEITYLPATDTNYLYARMSADGVFQYCEFATTVAE